MAAAKKKASTRVSPGASSPRVVAPSGEPSGRFLEVLAQTRAAGLAVDAFEITEDFVLQPPTEARLKAMEQYQAAYLLAQTTALDLLRSSGPAPDNDEERIAWAQTQQQALANAYAAGDEANEKYNEALYGGADVLQRVEEFFADRPGWEKEAFGAAVNAQFRRLPEDGRCRACGHVETAAGESEGESSGGSSTSGQSSRETSPPNSEVSTPATGSEAPAPGPSSSATPSE